MGEAKPMIAPEEAGASLEYIGPDAGKQEKKDQEVEQVDEDAEVIAAATGTLGASEHQSGYDAAQKSWKQESGRQTE